MTRKTRKKFHWTNKPQVSDKELRQIIRSYKKSAVQEHKEELVSCPVCDMITKRYELARHISKQHDLKL